MLPDLLSFAKVLACCTSPHLESFIIPAVGISTTQDTQLREVRVARGWEELQGACREHRSLSSVVFQQNPRELREFTDRREAVIREMLPDLEQSGILQFRKIGWLELE